MPTDAASSRFKSGFVVLSAISEFRDRALPRLKARPSVEGQSPPEFDPVLDSLEGQLRWASDDLFRKDTSYIHEVANDSKYLTERDVSRRDLSQVIQRTKLIFDGCYRPENIEEFGFPRVVSRDSEILYQQGLHLDLRLREPDLPLPDPISDLLVVDPVVIADVVNPLTVGLGKVLENVRRERRGAQLASLARNEALEFFDQTFLWVARTAESLFNLAGEKELAKRVRPSTTRPGRTETDPDVILAETGQTPPESDPADPTALTSVDTPSLEG